MIIMLQSASDVDGVGGDDDHDDDGEDGDLIGWMDGFLFTIDCS